MEAFANSASANESGTLPVMVLASRQLTALVLSGVLVVGLMACLGYLVGRAVTSAQDPQSRVQAQVTRPAALVVDPEVDRPSPMPGNTVQSAPAKQSPPPVSPAPPATPGTMYLQVGALDRGMADVFIGVLAQKGFTGRMMPGPDDKTFRVVVGPVTRAEVTGTKTALEQAGFTPFARVF